MHPQTVTTTLAITDTRIEVVCTHLLPLAPSTQPEPSDSESDSEAVARGRGRPRIHPPKVSTRWLANLLQNVDDLEYHRDAVRAHLAKHAETLARGVWVGYPISTKTYAWTQLTQRNQVSMP